MIIVTSVNTMNNVSMYTVLEPTQVIDSDELMTIIIRLKRMILRRPYSSGVGVIRDIVLMLDTFVGHHCHINVTDRDYSVHIATNATHKDCVTLNFIVKAPTFHVCVPIFGEDSVRVSTYYFRELLESAEVEAFTDQDIMNEVMEFLYDYSDFKEMIDE